MTDETFYEYEEPYSNAYVYSLDKMGETCEILDSYFWKECLTLRAEEFWRNIID